MVRAGFRELRQVPFASEEDLALTGDDDAVRVTNPLQADEGWLRTRLLPGLLRAAKRNAFRHVRSIALFEVGTVFRLEDGVVRERPSLGFVLSGATGEGWTGTARDFDVFDAKGVIEELLSELRVTWRVGGAGGGAFHPGRSATILVGGEPVGTFGELHPRFAAALDLSGRVAAGELDVEALMPRSSDLRQVRDVPRFPPVRRDLAFQVDAATPAGDVQRALEEAAGELLDSCLLFDVHEGPPLPAGAKSLAFSVDFRAPDRTLTDAEAAEAVAAVVERLARDFGARLRSG
jgi:phenylalanyl-tRNA synthetase beta chain